MEVFLDTEFVSLETSRLFSLGLVAGDCREHCVEPEPNLGSAWIARTAAEVSNFVRTTVLPL